MVKIGDGFLSTVTLTYAKQKPKPYFHRFRCSYNYVRLPFENAVHEYVCCTFQGMRDVAKDKEHMPNLEEEVREPLK